MARDRLAAMRVSALLRFCSLFLMVCSQGQQQGGGNNYSPTQPPFASNNSYPTQASGGGGGGYNSRNNPYAQQDDKTYEMSDVKDSQTHLTAAADFGGDNMSAFYSEISSLQDSLRTFNDNVSRIGDLHSRSLNNTDDQAAQRNAAQLEELVEDTSALSATLKRRIKALERSPGSGRDGQIRKQQTALVKSKFVEAIQNYQTVEQQFRSKYKQRMERQFKIVKPDASPEEVKAVVNDESGGQIFSQAMSVLVEQQEETINVIETAAAGVEKDTEVGLGYTEKAVDSARAARKKRWICFIICLVVLIIVGIIIAVVITQQVNKTK
ncbi:Plasma membrane t-SNARE, secretory vesicle fusion [Salix suchowensis]|nr:Plasma membrane t-SNARE, secretory vesicle fusion [Salix suchowensis]